MTINELEDYFNNAKLPEAPIYLDPSNMISDVDFFLKSHFEPLKRGVNQRMAQPLIDRLYRFKEIIDEQETD